MDQERRESQNSHWWIFAEDRGLEPIFSEVVGWKFSDDSSDDVNSRCGVNFGSNAVFTRKPNFIKLGLASVNTTDKLGSISVPTTRVVRPTRGSKWIQHGHDIEEATLDRMRKTRANSDYIFKSDFDKLWDKFKIMSGKIFLWVLRHWDDQWNCQSISPFHQRKMEKRTNQHQRISPFQQSKMEKCTYQINRTQTHHCNTRHRRKINTIRRNSVVNTGKIICQNHCQATILIRPMILITDASDVRGRAIRKSIRSNYAHN